MVSVYTRPDYRQDTDPDRIVTRACECIRADMASGEEDILPTFWPDFGTVSTAAMWGGAIIPPEGERRIHIEPIVQLANQLGSLSPCLFEESDFQRALDLYREICKRLETDEVFVRMPDLQGPLNTLSLLIPQTELLCAFYEDPASIHAALDHITDTLIAVTRRFLDAAGPSWVAGGIWPYLSLPGDLGICMTEDYMPLIGPDHYQAFGIPYVKRIADAFGGVQIHCCGVYGQHLPALRNGGFKIWGLESFYPQTPVWDLFEIFGADIAYLVGISPDGLADFPTRAAYADAIANHGCADARFWWCATTDEEETENLKQTVRSRFGQR